jgi:hypothetical protein
MVWEHGRLMKSPAAGGEASPSLPSANPASGSPVNTRPNRSFAGRKKSFLGWSRGEAYRSDKVLALAPTAKALRLSQSLDEGIQASQNPFFYPDSDHQPNRPLSPETSSGNQPRRLLPESKHRRPTAGSTSSAHSSTSSLNSYASSVQSGYSTAYIDTADPAQRDTSWTLRPPNRDSPEYQRPPPGWKGHTILDQTYSPPQVHRPPPPHHGGPSVFGAAGLPGHTDTRQQPSVGWQNGWTHEKPKRPPRRASRPADLGQSFKATAPSRRRIAPSSVITPIITQPFKLAENAVHVLASSFKRQEETIDTNTYDEIERIRRPSM